LAFNFLRISSIQKSQSKNLSEKYFFTQTLEKCLEKYFQTPDQKPQRFIGGFNKEHTNNESNKKISITNSPYRKPNT
jgi:hypothetical protein